MDAYTKCVLTIIAVALVAISIKLWEPKPVCAGFMDGGPTWGDVLNLRNLNGDALEEERTRIIHNLPLVKVYGTVDVDVR